MHSLFTENSKTEKRLREYIISRKDIKDKLDRLKKILAKQMGLINYAGD